MSAADLSPEPRYVLEKGVLMQTKLSIARFRVRMQTGHTFLGCVWILGLITGACWCNTVQDISSLMGVAARQNVSIVLLLTVTIFPLLLSAFAVYIRLPQLMIPITFLDALTVGYLLHATLLAFRGAGWLICLLLTFSDCFMRIPLFLFWFRYVSCPAHTLGRDLVCCVFFAVFICLLDRCFIAPFLTSLIY